MRGLVSVVFSTALWACVVVSVAWCQSKPRAKTIALTPSTNGIQPLFTGSPQAVTMKSGDVTLDPGRSVGRHSTAHQEEDENRAKAAGGRMI